MSNQINIGTFGHVDHGKTTLTAALSKISSALYGGFKAYDIDQIDKAPEEKKRGVTIQIAHVPYHTKSRLVAHIDCPGHADYLKNTIVGASQVDVAVLVVAANDGPLIQTTVHTALAKQMGVKKVIVYINKADIIDIELMDLIILDVRELLSTHGFDGDNATIIYGSALKSLNEEPGKYTELGGESIKKLLDAIDAVEIPERDYNSSFFMPIEDAFSVSGRGTVVTGCVKCGSLERNATVHIVGFNDEPVTTVVTSIEQYKKPLDKAVAGENVGLLLRGISRDEIERGQVIAIPNSVSAYKEFEAMFYLLKSEDGGRDKEVRDGYSPSLYVETASVTCVLHFLNDKKSALPGEDVSAKIVLHKSVALDTGFSFVLREGGKTIAHGLVTKLIK